MENKLLLRSVNYPNTVRKFKATASRSTNIIWCTDAR